MTSQFIKLKQFINGHTFWRAPDSNRIVISDQSGETPEQTDDGVLYIDESRDMMVQLLEGKIIQANIPVELSNGAKSRTPAALDELLYCQRVCDITTTISEPVMNLVAALEKLGIPVPETA